MARLGRGIPRVAYITKPLVFHEYFLSGDSTGTSEATGGLSRTETISGSSTGTSTATATLSRIKEISGSSIGTSTATGTLTKTLPPPGDVLEFDFYRRGEPLNTLLGNVSNSELDYYRRGEIFPNPSPVVISGFTNETGTSTGTSTASATLSRLRTYTVPFQKSLSNTAEGGTIGATVTTGNSDGSSGDAWSTVSIVTNSTITYETVGDRSGTVYQVYGGGTGAGNFSSMRWTFSAQKKVTTSFYWKSTSIAIDFIHWENYSGSAAGYLLGVVSATSKLRIYTGGGSTLATGTYTMSNNVWYKFEVSSEAGVGCTVVLKDTTGTTLDTVTYSGVSTPDTSGLTALHYGYAHGAVTQHVDDISATFVAPPTGTSSVIGDFVRTRVLSASSTGTSSATGIGNVTVRAVRSRNMSML